MITTDNHKIGDRVIVTRPITINDANVGEIVEISPQHGYVIYWTSTDTTSDGWSDKDLRSDGSP